MREQHTDRKVADLAGARMPADHGMSGLGLIMQLGGSVFLGYMAFIAMVPVFGGATGSGGFFLFLIGAAGVLRSWFHRAAGGALIYGSPRGHIQPVYTYLGVAVCQSVLTVAVFHHVMPSIPLSVDVGLLMTLLGWPVALIVTLRSPRLRRLAEEGLPVAEDMGFEGAAVLMCLLGAVGALFAALCLYSLFRLPGAALSSPHGLLFIGVFGMLLVRSIFHINAGVRGTRGIDSDGASDAASRYYSFGVASSVIAGGALLVELVMNTLDPRALILVSALVYFLLVWPLILRRFYSERNFSALLAGAEGPNYRRAPDAGLTALGWLLLALGLLELGMAIPGLVSAANAGALQGLLLGAMQPDLAARFAGSTHSSWWQVLVAAGQLWAGLELIGMTDRHRLAGTVYGVVASVVAIYLAWPTLHSFSHGAGVLSPTNAVMLVPLAMTLVAPVGTLILVNRALTPTAQAHIRPTEDA